MQYLLTNSRCPTCRRSALRDIPLLSLPPRIGFGDTVSDWIHLTIQRHLVRAMCFLRCPFSWIYAVRFFKPCVSCQRRRRLLNILFPYLPRTSLQYRAWNAYLASGLSHLPVIWDSSTDTITPV